MANRIDKELVIRKLIDSRSKAQEIIKNKCVFCNNKLIDKTSFIVEDNDDIKIKENNVLRYVSRGGLKLEKALKEFNIDINNKNIMDIGASTGGFTDCALKFGAHIVKAIDVGSNLIHESLRNDKRVLLYENTNVKDIANEVFNDVDLIVCDVSFISLKLVIDKIATINSSFDLIFLIKPQFECGKEIARKYKGVVLNKAIHLQIIDDLVNYFEKKGYYLNSLTFSPIKGGDGNIEYLAYFKADKTYSIDRKKIVEQAFLKK